jgi:hypothetical protein
MFHALRNGDQQLLLLTDGEMVKGAATVSIEQFPNRRIAFVTALGGEGVVHEQCFALLAEWAESVGCDAVRGAFRPAMARLVGRVGFEQQYIIMERPLWADQAAAAAAK